MTCQETFLMLKADKPRGKSIILSNYRRLRELNVFASGSHPYTILVSAGITVIDIEVSEHNLILNITA